MLKHFEVTSPKTIDEMFAMIKEMKSVLEGLAEGILPNDSTYTVEELTHYLTSLVANQRGCLGRSKPGSFSVALDDDFMDSDARVDFIFRPTYIATATLSRVFMDNPELCATIPNYTRALRTGLQYCSLRYLAPAGIDDAITEFDTVSHIFEMGRVIELLARDPELCPSLLAVVRTIRSTLSKRLESGNTTIAPYMGSPEDRRSDMVSIINRISLLS